MTIHFNKLSDPVQSASASYDVVRRPKRAGLYRNFFKRVLDVVIILLLAPFLVPAVLVLALVVARDGSNPFYRSERVGRGGEEFGMLKLRTMVPNADRLLEDHLAANPAANVEWEKTQKLKDDPRITKVGRFLRKSSLDELPQFWNVLLGQMSIVGPRPMLPSQQVIYPGPVYFSMRPGITGPWQVSDRNQSEFARRAEHDKAYNEQLSLVSDLKFIGRTVGVMLKGTGY